MASDALGRPFETLSTITLQKWPYYRKIFVDCAHQYLYVIGVKPDARQSPSDGFGAQDHRKIIKILGGIHQ